MANRLSTIMTKSGDQGQTGLGDGSRVEKTHPRIEALGDVDELNASIGVARAMIQTQRVACPNLAGIAANLEAIAHALFQVGSALAVPGYEAVSAADLAYIEAEAQALNDALPPLEEFILPGGTPLAAQLHWSRTIGRRAERHVWALSAIETQSPLVLAYLNRLSDYLFIAARAANQALGAPDVLWASERMKRKGASST